MFVYLLYIMGMGMPHADHSMSAIKIQILLVFIVPYLAAFAFHDVHIEQGIYVK